MSCRMIPTGTVGTIGPKKKATTIAIPTGPDGTLGPRKSMTTERHSGSLVIWTHQHVKKSMMTQRRNGIQVTGAHQCAVG